jgi:hypothetical protein
MLAVITFSGDGSLILMGWALFRKLSYFGLSKHKPTLTDFRRKLSDVRFSKYKLTMTDFRFFL